MSLIKKFFSTLKNDPGEALRKTTRRLLPYQWLEHGKTSYIEHNRGYESDKSMEWHRERFKDYAREDLFNAPANRIRDLIGRYPDVRDIAIDIGCGGGWASAELSRTFKQVIGLEPSAAAVATAQGLFPPATYPTIAWRVGFAQDIIPTLSIKSPALWITMAVLSHLPDDSVRAICSAVNQAAPVGSLLSFAECWGPEFHDLLWHARTPEWWKRQLPGWELEFHGPSVNNVPERRKGIHGRKIR